MAKRVKIRIKGLRQFNVIEQNECVHTAGWARKRENKKK